MYVYIKPQFVVPSLLYSMLWLLWNESHACTHVQCKSWATLQYYHTYITILNIEENFSVQ